MLWDKISRYFGSMMILVYITAGIIIILNDSLFPDFSTLNRRLLGGMIVGYGVYRLYAFIRKMQDDQNDDQEE